MPKIVTLGDVAKIVGGGTPATSRPDFWDGGVLWATPTDLGNITGRFISKTARTISATGLQSCSAEVLPAGSILFSSRAPIGHVAINLEPMATNQGFKSMVPDPDAVDPSYLYWWLVKHRERLQAMGNGATFKELSKNTMSRIQLSLPEIREQRQLARRLNDVADSREVRRASLSLFDELERALLARDIA